MEFRNDSNLTISRMAPLLRRGELSPLELTRWFIARIERLQAQINAYITVTADLALRQAKRAEREIFKGQYRGPLHGIPVNLKDLFCTRGIRTTAGSSILKRFRPSEDATVVRRLSDAGVVLLGKTNLHEFAYGATSVNLHYGPVRNPWDKLRMSGGSSGGSAAAVSAGLAVASLGTDTGGSIRIPAAACGCVGLKPTRGLVPVSGVIPLAATLDHVGPICRSVEDAAFVLSAIAGPDPSDQCPPSPAWTFSSSDLRKTIRGTRIGIPRQYFFARLQKEVRSSVLAAIAKFEDLGCKIREVNLALTQETARLASIITVAEALSYHLRWLETRSADYDPTIRARMEADKNITAVEYLLAQQKRRAYTVAFERAMSRIDIMAVPTLPIVAPKIQENEVVVGRFREDVRVALLRLTRPGNLTGLPSISLPCGVSAGNLPIGLQLIGKRWCESALLRVAFAYEQATPWHDRFPEP